MESKKRERAANFETAEIQLLISLVERHKSIIENKRTDAITNKDKESAWRKIECYFNSCGVKSKERTWKTLKLKYEGLKKSTKKKSSLHRQEMYKTGGGPSHAPDFDLVDEKVLSICSNIKGLDARYDCDTIDSPKPEASVATTTIEILDEARKDVTTLEDLDTSFIYTENKENENPNETDNSIIFISQQQDRTLEEKDDESETGNKWDKWQPKALKTKVSTVLQERVTKGSVTSKIDKLAASRLELVELQKDIARKEHTLKIAHMENEERRKEELHSLMIEKLKKDLK